MSIRVVIIEDYETLLSSFVEIINSTDEFIVVGGYTNCEDAIINFKHDNPDVMLIDVQLPGINGIEGIKQFKALKPSIPTVVITVHEDSKYIFDALCAGAVGYLTKNTEPQELISALIQAHQGGAPMSAKIARRVVESFQNPKEKDLSDRENDVLELLAKGKSYATIAKELHLSKNTIKTHTRNIYEKLQINNREEIIQKYNR
ncbi:response regulator transcription factor [Aquimarina sp. 2201CG5-10]|uniref:response regulator transcription factor n=1 Tax=Aquimarina callyspongiae TaxID=3098150 RepID=UPI002AB4D12E|nr:response regulator transcription factor [Aquimarina sp. 2201CG5-10]MDY8138451.1 response regulator transcription factor [Aquimarina sp. 2201CG5-10]